MSIDGAFDGGAGVWDLFSPPEARLKKEGPFLAAWAGSSESILELACGIGAHSAFLAGCGPDTRHVTATDLSPGMVAQAKLRNAHPRVSFSVGSMTEPPGGPFDRILILGNSVNLLPLRSQVQDLWKSLARVLKPGGEILLQFLNPGRPEHREPRVQGFPRMRGDEKWYLVKSMVPHGGKTHLTLSAFPEGGGPSGVQSAVLLDLSPEEADDVAVQAGLSRGRFFGGMDGSPFDPANSTDAIGIWRAGGT